MADETFSKTQVIDLIKQLTGQANLLTTPSLFVAALGDMNAAVLLGQILYWQERTTREDGYFWKSRREWNDELRLSAKEVRRATEVLKRASCGLETKLLRAEGSPTIHYRLDEGKFLGWIMEESYKVSQMDLSQRANGIAPQGKTITNITSEITTSKEERYKKEEKSTPLKEHEAIFNAWNQEKVIVHRRLTASMVKACTRALKDYDMDEILQAIRNYSEILSHPDEYYFSYKWSLDEFLVRGLKKFTDLEVCKANFRKRNGGSGKMIIVDDDAEALVEHYLEKTHKDPDDGRYSIQANEVLKSVELSEAIACIDWLVQDEWWRDKDWSLLAIAKTGIQKYRKMKKKQARAPGAGRSDEDIGGVLGVGSLGDGVRRRGRDG